MFRAVSFGVSRSLFPGAKATMGGLDPKTLKNEKGAALMRPSESIVVIHAMGRGVISEARIL